MTESDTPTRACLSGEPAIWAIANVRAFKGKRARTQLYERKPEETGQNSSLATEGANEGNIRFLE